jgi:16S rRNA (cytosine967-C5)-methyltransferase
MKTRVLVYTLLNRWTKGEDYPEALLQATFARYPSLSRLDKAFITELFYGTIRWLNQLDYIIDSFTQIRPQKIEAKVRNLLRLGIYQILHLEVPDGIAVYETVEVAKEKRFPPWIIKFINALLRAVVRQKEAICFPEDDLVRFIALKYAHPEWLVRRWLKEFGEEATINLCAFNNTPPPLIIRTNTLKITRAELKQKLEKAGVEVEVTKFSPEGLYLKRLPCSLYELPGFKNGLFLPQVEMSQIISHLSSPKPHETILDACAGVGGKTTHLAQLMRNQGQIFAVEPNKKRLKRLQKHIKKMDITIVYPRAGRIEEVITAFPKCYFDRILIDAPCSGLGVLRQNIDLKWQRQEKEIQELACLQISLLNTVAPYVKKKGILLYATCTLTSEENQEVIKRFLDTHPHFMLEDLKHRFPQYASFCTQAGYFQSLPFKHQLEGFFAACLRRL